MTCRPFFILTLLVVFCCILPFKAYSSSKTDFLAVTSFGIKPYEDVLNGFKEACNCTVKEFFLGDTSGQELFREIYKQKPKAILAIGKKALGYFNDFNRLPVIYAMTLFPGYITKGKKNFAGVSMFLPPHELLESIQEVSSNIKRVGLIYTQKTPADFIERAEHFAGLIDIELISRKIECPELFASALNELKNLIDIFWMIPDTSMITSETIEQLFLFSLNSNIPVTSFSKNFLNIGAFMSMTLDPFSIGKQTADVAKSLLSGKIIQDGYVEYPNVAEISINYAVAQKLGIELRSKFARGLKEERIFSLFRHSKDMISPIQ